MVLAEILRQSATHHSRLCPRQVLGARMALRAGRELGVELPHSGRDLLVILETNGCVADAVAAATGCTVGRRTLRIEDYGKVAATFADLQADAAIRVVPNPAARTMCREFAPEIEGQWEAMLAGYQRMPDQLLLTWRRVSLRIPASTIMGRAHVRVRCEICGEEVINGRELLREGRAMCSACCGNAYYQTCAGSPLAGEAEPVP
jgi:formylmethanofuran dehydrogenase subunit E